MSLLWKDRQSDCYIYFKVVGSKISECDPLLDVLCNVDVSVTCKVHKNALKRSCYIRKWRSHWTKEEIQMISTVRWFQLMDISCLTKFGGYLNISHLAVLRVVVKHSLLQLCNNSKRWPLFLLCMCLLKISAWRCSKYRVFQKELLSLLCC